ncbi:MAG: phosphatase PAP2 family protein [Gemmatimonadaceae bacterium]
MQGFISRLAAQDRALYFRWCISDRAASRVARTLWTVVTHIGGVTCSILAAILPRFAGGTLAAAARQALIALVASHLVVQLVKRTVGRPRPSRTIAASALVEEPDQFSFPSGHSAAAMSVAVVYALWFPAFAAPLMAFAALVGLSRVALGVHYPGDVFVGQLIAAATAIVVVR